MKDLFVPYAIALKLKEKGFDGLVLAVYHNGELCDLYSSSRWLRENPEIIVKAPLYQQVMDWLEEKNLYITVKIMDYGYGEWWIYSLEQSGVVEVAHGISMYSSFPWAYKDAIEQALKLL